MVTIKQAAAKALEFARDVYGEQAVQAPRVDEVERDDADWQITVSWLQPFESALLPPGLGGMLPPNLGSNRIYKRFVVNAENGEVKAMRIRQVE